MPRECLVSIIFFILIIFFSYDIFFQLVLEMCENFLIFSGECLLPFIPQGCPFKAILFFMAMEIRRRVDRLTLRFPEAKSAIVFSELRFFLSSECFLPIFEAAALFCQSWKNGLH